MVGNGKRELIRALIVDHHAVVRAGYKALLGATQDIQVTAEANSGEAACRLYKTGTFDVVIMDLSLPGMHGLEAIGRLVSRDPSVGILVFSMSDELAFVEQAMQAGALGYITKLSAPEVLVEAVRQVARGEVYMDSHVANHLAHRRPNQTSPFEPLSRREFQIFRLLAEGLGVSAIADRLSLSYKTVANYSTQIKNKLGVNSTVDLARLAIRHGLIEA